MMRTKNSVPTQFIPCSIIVGRTPGDEAIKVTGYVTQTHYFIYYTKELVRVQQITFY